MGINKFNAEGYYDPTAYEAIQRTLLQTAEGKTDALHRYPHFD
jgi:hypothetical protein